MCLRDPAKFPRHAAGTRPLESAGACTVFAIGFCGNSGLLQGYPPHCRYAPPSHAGKNFPKSLSVDAFRAPGQSESCIHAVLLQDTRHMLLVGCGGGLRFRRAKSGTALFSPSAQHVEQPCAKAPVVFSIGAFRLLCLRSVRLRSSEPCRGTVHSAWCGAARNAPPRPCGGTGRRAVPGCALR